ncbi:alpha/beta fold hydrolase [Nocardioides sp. CPCC 206347]|uniref:alpha/beta fold hydrolase n=1 Tax=unclassified Nocardioides TaxID=2615069 RepID=UPI0036219E4D
MLPRRDAPARVLLLHGMGCGPWVWRDVEQALPTHLTALPVVIAGHRGGTRLSRTAANTVPEQMVDDLERQLDHLGIDRIHVVGNSLGGWLALRLAERGRALSVLCLAPAGGWRPGSVGERLVVSRFVIGHRIARRLDRKPRLLRATGVRRAVLAPVVHDPMSVELADAVRFVQDLADCQALRAAIVHPPARELNAILRIGAPTTIAWSGDDRVLSGPWAREGFRHLLVNEVDIPDVGHLPMLDDPGVVAGLIANRVRSAAPPSP